METNQKDFSESKENICFAVLVRSHLDQEICANETHRWLEYDCH